MLAVIFAAATQEGCRFQMNSSFRQDDPESPTLIEPPKTLQISEKCFLKKFHVQ